MVTFEVQRVFEHLDKISYEIGPRLAGTGRSQQAAEYIKEKFEEFGLETRFQNFDFVDRVSQMKSMSIILAFTIILAPILYLYIGPIAALLTLIGGYGISYWLPSLALKKSDKNVVGTFNPGGEVKNRIIVGAHYDSAYCVKSRSGALLFKFLFYAFLVAFLALSILGFFIGTGTLLWAWTVLAVPYIFVLSIPFWLYLDLISPGANDNASGVSLMLEVARAVSESSLENTEVRFVAFGGEEQGLAGSKDFSERTTAPDFFLNIDSVGGEHPVVIRGNGIFRKVRTSSRLNGDIEKSLGEKGIWTPFSGHDHIPFIKKGIEATTLSSSGVSEKNSLDGYLEKFFRLPNVRTRRLPEIHTLEDIPDKVSLESVERSGSVIMDLLGIKGE